MSNCKQMVVLTVGSEAQKLLCSKMLSEIKDKFAFDIKIVSDDDSGFRLGSGGAVLKLLHKYYKKNCKLLIINSGGMSKRSINYALKGKAFANVLYESETVFLLELILINACKLMQCFEKGTLVCCSDILVDIDWGDMNFSDNTCVCIGTDYLTASRHGVALYDNEGRMLSYLHKRSVKELQKVAEEYSFISMPADTGITYFTQEFTLVLSELFDESVSGEKKATGSFEISLYSDIISLLSKNITKAEYLALETQNEKHLKFKEMLFDILSGFTMNVICLSSQKFLHFGTMVESLENIFYLSGEADRALLLNSFVDDDSEIGNGTVLDTVKLSSCKVGSGCLLSDITLENISVEANKSLCGIKLSDGSYVAIICDIHENPKNLIGDKALWEAPRFYKASSFTESLRKFYNQFDETVYSMAYCVENADYNYCFTRLQYFRDMSDYTISDDYLKKRKQIIEHHFNRINLIDKIQCVKDRVEVLLPLRINLSGTWTDAMPYCIDNGGQVINMAVTVDGEKPVRVIVEKLDESGKIEFCSDGSTVVFSFMKEDSDEDLSDFILHKSALKTIGITDKTIIRHGFRLTTDVKGIDKGSGLGTSSILLGGCFKALGEMFSLNYSDSELLKMVFVAEQIMKTGGGWQDQVGGLVPGLKAGTTVAGVEQELDVKQINVSPFYKKLFSERVFLLPTGQRHFGRFIVNDVVNRYLVKNSESIEGHIKIRQLNDVLEKSLLNDDYEGFIHCINKHRELLRLISHKVTNDEIEAIVEKCFEMADAVSYLGAGGGGYLLVVLKENFDIDTFKAFVKEQFPNIASAVKKIDICYDI